MKLLKIVQPFSYGLIIRVVEFAPSCRRYADGSIGNVMGSNSVNVFLGLGLPSAGWKVQREAETGIFGCGVDFEYLS